MSNNIYSAITSLIPDRLIYQNKLYSITEIDDDHIINSYKIYLDDDDRIQMLKIDCDHPNSDPVTDVFCLPYNIRNRYLSKKLIKEIELSICQYNINHPYFAPWSYISYNKYNQNEHTIKQEEKNNSIIMKTFKFINSIRNFNVNIIE